MFLNNIVNINVLQTIKLRTSECLYEGYVRLFKTYNISDKRYPLWVGVDEITETEVTFVSSHMISHYTCSVNKLTN